MLRGSWRASPSCISAIFHGCGNSKGRCRAFSASSGTNFNFNFTFDVGVGSGVYPGSNRGGRRRRTPAVLSARLPPLVFLSLSSSFSSPSPSASSSPSQSPLSTAAVVPSLRPPLSAGSAATAPGSGSAFDGGEGEAEGEWPIPEPSQAFVARARDGVKYEHDVSGAGARRIRVVVSDLDGTLLGPDKLVSARTLEAVRRARCETDDGDGGWVVLCVWVCVGR